MKHMRWLFLPSILIVAANLVHGGGDKGKKEGKLEGKWVAALKGQKFEMTFAKDTFVIVIPDKETIKGTYTTEPSKKPAHMDMLVKEGDAKAVGKTALCIYEVEGDTLKWCANDPSAKNSPRPKEFPDKEGGGPDHMYLIFKRAK